LLQNRQATRSDVAYQGLAEEASVLAVELARTFIANLERRTDGIESTDEHSVAGGALNRSCF